MLNKLRYKLFNWKFKKWCEFAYNHKLYVTIDDNYLKQFVDIRKLHLKKYGIDLDKLAK